MLSRKFHRRSLLETDLKFVGYADWQTAALRVIDVYMVHKAVFYYVHATLRLIRPRGRLVIFVA